MGTINYKDPSLLATLADNGIMSAADKAKLDSINLDGYATVAFVDGYVASSVLNETFRAENAESNLQNQISALDIVTDGYATINYVDGYACSNTDPRLSNSRTPTAHAPTHIAGGSDPIDGYHIPMAYTPVNYTAPVDGYIGEHIAQIDQRLASAGSSVGNVQTIRFAINTSATQTSSTSIPSTAIVQDCILRIDTPFSPGTTIKVGRSGSLNLLQDTPDNDPTISALYKAPQDTAWSVAGGVVVTVAGGPIAGAGYCTVNYVVPKN